LTDVQPGGGNEDHEWSADGDVATGTVDTRDAGEQADGDGVVVQHTGNSGQSGGVIEVADPGPVNVGVDGGSGEATRVVVPGTVNSGADQGSGGVVRDMDPNLVNVSPGQRGVRHGPGRAVNVLGQGTSPGQVGEQQVPGTVNVGGNGGADGPGKVLSPCNMADVTSHGSRYADGQRDPGTMVDNGRMDDEGNRGEGQASGVGAWSRRYTCDPTVGARPQRYKSGPRSRRHVDERSEEQSRRQPSLKFGRSSPKISTSEAGQSSTTAHAHPDDAAIAGDPQSTQRPADRPRRATRQPGR